MNRRADGTDESGKNISYREAFDIIGANVWPKGDEELPLDLCAGRVVAADLVARKSHPGADISLKDGFAIKSRDVVRADKRKPVKLEVVGAVSIGRNFTGQVKDGGAVKISAGALVPGGANAVVTSEFCDETSPREILVKTAAPEGCGILCAGGAIEAGSVIVRSGERLSLGYISLVAMAGISRIKVRRRPRVAAISIGDQIAAPGEKLHPGQHYAGNLVTIAAWLASFGIACETAVIADDEDDIRQELQKHPKNVDAVLTIGGTREPQRSFVFAVLNKLGWQELFNRVRMEPGEDIVFGIWEHMPVFCLPGDPDGNRMAFLQVALPALLRMSGETRHPLQAVPARLTEEVKSRYKNWTGFRYATITLDTGGCYTAALYKNRSNLQTIAGASGLICIPEGKETLRSGEVVPVQLLASRLDDL